jgi:replicative DNA helicase
MTAVAEWSQPSPPALATPWPTLDDLLGGGLRGVSLVAGPPGRGKSGFAIQSAHAIARTTPTIYFSTELSSRQVKARFVAQELRQSWLQLFEGGPSTGVVVEQVLRPLNLWVVEVSTAAQVLESLQSISDHVKAPVFAVVDYLQGLCRDPVLDRRLAVGAVSQMLVDCSRTFGATILAVSSTSRAYYAAGADAGKRAGDYVSAGKESGDVEFDASAVLYIDIEECALGGSSTGRLHVAKSRFGTLGTVGVRFHGVSGTFAEDALGSLTADQREVYDAIEGGATSKALVLEAVRRRTDYVVQMIHDLVARGLIETRPYRVKEGIL